MIQDLQIHMIPWYSAITIMIAHIAVRMFISARNSSSRNRARMNSITAIINQQISIILFPLYEGYSLGTIASISSSLSSKLYILIIRYSTLSVVVVESGLLIHRQASHVEIYGILHLLYLVMLLQKKINRWMIPRYYGT